MNDFGSLRVPSRFYEETLNELAGLDTSDSSPPIRILKFMVA